MSSLVFKTETEQISINKPLQLPNFYVGFWAISKLLQLRLV